MQHYTFIRNACCLLVLGCTLFFNHPRQVAPSLAGAATITTTTGNAIPVAAKIIPALEQVNGEAFIKAGLTGKSVKIGVIDVGFYNADLDSTLFRCFLQKRVAETKDYIYTNQKELYKKHSDMDWHGTKVWSLIGGRDAKEVNYGLATDAVYYLARTDDGLKEYFNEQEYFRQALAWMRSKGVRLVNTSLGYAYGFDNPAENYVPENMDGKTAAITKAAEEAISKYNMIIVTSAGNDGDNVWKIISAPADAKNVIAVGATDAARNKRVFSSEGPDFLPYLKPNISCMNHTGGTSFSAPVITGMIACMLQKKPQLTNVEIKSIIEKSGHLYPYGNNYQGYGVPDADRILKLLGNPAYDFKRAKEITATGNEVQVPVDKSAREITLFHKKDKWVVLKQEKFAGNKDMLTIKRPAEISRSKLVVEDKVKAKYHTVENKEKVARTTVVAGEKVIEITWPK